MTVRLLFIIGADGHARAFAFRHSSIGSGTVMHKASVNAKASVGNDCIVNTSALIDHDCQVGAHCHISTGPIVDFGVRVSTRCFVGNDSVVCEERAFGNGSVIGVGPAIRRGVAPDTIFTD